MSARKMLLICIAAVPHWACSQSTGDQTNDGLRTITDPFEANALIAKSVNLGNALEAPAEGEWGVTLKAEYFELIKSAGFTGVRVPIRWSAHARIDPPFTVDGSFFDRIDWVVEQARNNDLAAVLNIHHYDELFAQPAEQKTRFLALWRQIAEHYQNADPEIMFEILNEPHDQLTPQLWNQYLAEALSVIRESNPHRTVVVGTAEWGGIGSVDRLEVPPNEPNLIVTVHYYNPFQFTHQGAEWVEGSDAWLGTTWDGTTSEQQAVDDDFSRVVSWANEHGLPVFLGEFGSYRTADPDSRHRWTKYVAQAAGSRNFSWAYWEFCAGFGLYDPDTGEWNTGLIQALFPVN
jgi:endoglucanase